MRKIFLILLIAALVITGTLFFLIFYSEQMTPEISVMAGGYAEPMVISGEITLPVSNKVVSDDIQTALADSYDEIFQSSFAAKAAYVVDEAGEVIYAYNENEKLFPASTTKLMTAYLAVTMTEDLDALITVGPLSGCYEEGSMLLYLEEGDQISMRDLLYAMLLCSYNDAATAVAMEIGGSVEGFAKLMNEKAAEIGAKDTHFMNPHGLHDEDHYTTAHDLNLILRLASQNELIREMMLQEEQEISIFANEKEWIYELTNWNFYVRGLYSVSGMEYVAGKTGHTQKAGSCLASVFEKDGARYYSTILKAKDALYMTAILLDYYFAPDALAAFAASGSLMQD